MSETSTTAMLVGTPDMFAERASTITATVPRDEIAQALATEPPADLILDVVRRTSSDEAERRAVNVAWTQDDLESLLKLPGGESVTFYFDPDELERLLEDADVEGHGLREAAAVLSIAAAAAVGAGNAAAIPDPGGAGQAQSAAVAAHDEASLTERGIERTAAVHDEASYAARGIEPGTLPATHDEATLVARGIEHAPAVHDEASLVARGIEPGTTPAVHDEATLVARGIVEDAPVSVADTGSGLEFPSVEPGTAAAVTGALAGAGLLIVGAAFATRRRELRHP